MKFSSSAFLTTLLASLVSADKTLHTFSILDLRSATAVHFSFPYVNDKNELVIDKTQKPFVGVWMDDSTVQYQNTSLWLAVSADNKVVVADSPQPWSVTGEFSPTETFQGYLTHAGSSGYIAVPYANGQGYHIYTSKHATTSGDGSIPFSMMPVWNNYTVPDTSAPAPPKSTATKKTPVVVQTVTEWAKPVTVTVKAAPHTLSTVVKPAPVTVTVTETCTVTK